MQREKLFMFSVFTMFTHTKKMYCKFALKIIAWVFFSEDIKMWPSYDVLNWYTCNWLLFDIHM